MRCYWFLGLLLVMMASCRSEPDRFRQQFDSEFSLKYKDALHMKVTSIGCAFEVQEAIRTARKNAALHLRSVLGNQRHATRFREVSRFEKDGQICVEMEVESKKP